MAKGFTFLGTRGRSSVTNYADSSVVGWPWGWVNQDSWSGCDTLPSSVVYGELVYFDIHLTTSNKDARIFVLANYKSGTTLYARNIVCYAADGTKIAGVNLTSGGSGYGGIDFDDLFEAAIGDLPGTTFANLSPTCKYSGYSGNYANYRGFFKSGSTAYDAGGRGSNPSNTVIYTSPQGSGTYTISKAEGGVSVNGTTYYNSSRGSYPYGYVGLLMCGGGGSGGGGYSGGSRGGGGGGGGGGAVLCLLDLDEFEYTVDLSQAYGGAVAKLGSNGNSGGDAVLYESGSGSELVWTYGGGGGSYGQSNAGGNGGSGGTVGIFDEDHCTIIANASGGSGGKGGGRTTNGTAASGCSCSGYLVGTASSSYVTAGSGGSGTPSRYQGGAGGGSIGNGAAPASAAGSAGSYGSGGSGGGSSKASGAGGGGCFKLYY